MKKQSPLINRLLRRPDKVRLQIAAQLFQSIEQRIDPEIEKAWRIEVRKRLKEMERGERKFIPWEVVREKLRRHLRAA
jgi:putative addiction module component (TIGR02574 family)